MLFSGKYILPETAPARERKRGIFPILAEKVKRDFKEKPVFSEKS
jgi:hypothetical protein